MEHVERTGQRREATTFPLVTPQL